nr:LLGL scribble cell polarity complex component 2-like [Lytechinus pictus]
MGIHNGDFSVSKLFFLPAQGRIISLLDDNSLHLWEINQKDGGSTMDEVKNFMIEGRLKKISVCCLSSDSSRLYLGTEGGNIYLLDVESFELKTTSVLPRCRHEDDVDEDRTGDGGFISG